MNKCTSFESLRVFACHDNKDKEILSKLKNIFSFHEIDFFLAHEDIPGGSAYVKEIKSKLKKCDVFLLYANKKSQESNFCNQEIGGAILLKKLIIIIGDETTEDFHWCLMERKQAHIKTNTGEINYYRLFLDILKIIPEEKFTTNKTLSEKLKCAKSLFDCGLDGFRIHCADNIDINPLPENKINLVSNGLKKKHNINTNFDLFLGKEKAGELSVSKYEPRPATMKRKALPYDGMIKDFLYLPKGIFSIISPFENTHDYNKIIIKEIKDLLNGLSPKEFKNLFSHKRRSLPPRKVT